MKNFAITATRDPHQAATRLLELERYADRRDQTLDTLDLDALGPNQLYQIFQDQDAIEEAIDWGHLYLAHLASMAELEASLSRAIPLAA